jgi:hypothetical protein
LRTLSSGAVATGFTSDKGLHREQECTKSFAFRAFFATTHSGLHAGSESPRSTVSISCSWLMRASFSPPSSADSSSTGGEPEATCLKRPRFFGSLDCARSS